MTWSNRSAVLRDTPHFFLPIERPAADPIKDRAEDEQQRKDDVENDVQHGLLLSAEKSVKVDLDLRLRLIAGLQIELAMNAAA